MQPVNNLDSGLVARTKINDNFTEINTKINAGFTSGQLLIGNAAGGTSKSTITAGAGITVVNGDGNITISAPQVGTVTSVNASGGSTGLTFTGGPITSTGTLSLGGTLAVANGGTGVATSTGTGSVVLSTSPTLVTPALGTPSSATLTNATGLPIDGGTTGTLPVARGGTGVTLSTGTGSVVLSNSPALVTPTLGAAAATSIAADLGAVGTPSYTFTGDTNTGMWSPSSDAIAFSTAGGERVRVDSSGNVGIGISGPSYKLDVSGGTVGTTAGNLVSIGRLSAVAGGNIVSLQTTLNRVSNGTDWTTTALRVQAQVDLSPFGYIDFLAGSNGQMAFGRASSEFMRISDTGNVGIGTSSPGSLLQLNRGSGAADVRLSVGGTLHGTMFASSSDLTINAVSAIPLTLGTNNTERMRIDSSGNVGIGTSAPTARLDVLGDFVARTNVSTGNSPVIAKNDNSGNNTTKSTGVLFQGVDTVGTSKNVGVVQYGPADANWVGSYFAVQTRSGDALSERMRIDSNGNVGIGTSSLVAGRILTVNGSPTFISPGSTFNLDLDGSSGAQGVGLEASFAAGGFGPLRFRTGGAERARIDSSGNVGIGTSSPNAPLTVKSRSSDNIGCRVLASANGTGAIQFTDDPVTLGWAIIAASSSALNMTSGTGVVTLGTDGAERMRIDASGNLLVGTTGLFSGYGAKQTIFWNAEAQQGLTLRSSTDTYTGNPIIFVNASNTTSGFIAQSASSVTYNTSSDARLKHNIVDAPDAADLIDAIKVRSFKWNADNSDQRYGMVAQELREVAPEAVSVPADENQMMGVDYSKLVPMMLKEIQSLRARVAQLEKERV